MLELARFDHGAAAGRFGSGRGAIVGQSLGDAGEAARRLWDSRGAMMAQWRFGPGTFSGLPRDCPGACHDRPRGDTGGVAGNPGAVAGRSWDTRGAGLGHQRDVVRQSLCEHGTVSEV